VHGELEAGLAGIEPDRSVHVVDDVADLNGSHCRFSSAIPAPGIFARLICQRAGSNGGASPAALPFAGAHVLGTEKKTVALTAPDQFLAMRGSN